MPKETIDVQLVDKKTGRVVWEGTSINANRTIDINVPHEHIPDGYVYPIGFIELVAEFEEQYQSYEEASKMDKEYYKENMENIIKAMQLAYPKETDKYVEGKLDPKNYQ